jgi:neocarzinostatin family protein
VKLRTAIAAVAVLAMVLVACGGDDDDSASGGTTTVAPSETTATPTLPSTTTTTSPPSPYKATVTPSSGLTDGQEVTISVTGFKAGLTLGLNECAQKGDGEVGANDCALDHLATLKVGADGTGTGTTKVYIKDVGANKHDCTAADTRCFFSVGELSADPNAQRADDVNITFG